MFQARDVLEARHPVDVCVEFREASREALSGEHSCLEGRLEVPQFQRLLKRC